MHRTCLQHYEFHRSSYFNCANFSISRTSRHYLSCTSHHISCHLPPTKFSLALWQSTFPQHTGAGVVSGVSDCVATVWADHTILRLTTYSLASMAHVGVPKVLFMSSLWIYKDCVCWWVSKRKHTMVTPGTSAAPLCSLLLQQKTAWCLTALRGQSGNLLVDIKSSACSERSENMVFLNACLNTKVRKHLSRC